MKIIISFTFCIFLLLAGNQSKAQTGNIQYSAIVKVNINKAVEMVSVYPNPVQGNNVNLNINAEKGTYSVVITNNNGQQMFTKVINHNGGSATQTISLDNNFVSGNYQLQVTGNNFSQTIKVLKP